MYRVVCMDFSSKKKKLKTFYSDTVQGERCLSFDSGLKTLDKYTRIGQGPVEKPRRYEN